MEPREDRDAAISRWRSECRCSPLLSPESPTTSTTSQTLSARERPSMKYKARGVAPTGCTILSSINSGTYSAWNYLDKNHRLDKSPIFPATDLAERFHIRGDTTNSDINACTGDDTKYWAWFNESNVTVDLDLNDPACRKTDGALRRIEPFRDEPRQGPRQPCPASPASLHWRQPGSAGTTFRCWRRRSRSPRHRSPRRRGEFPTFFHWVELGAPRWPAARR